MPRMRKHMQIKGQSVIRPAAFPLAVAALTGFLFLSGAAAALGSSEIANGDVRIQGAGARPQLIFACGDESTDELGFLVANPATISDLKELQASLAVAITDLSPGRAESVRQLNKAGIPLYAWISLPQEQGYYLNADNAPEAAARFNEFNQWTRNYGLQWAGVGLDIEPNFGLFNGSKWHVASLLIRRSLDGGRVRRARQAYSALIQQIQSQGYAVQTYQMPFIVDDRELHSTLIERLSGVVDARGNLEVLMLYTSFARRFDSALIWKFGPDAQAIAVGSTAIDPNGGAQDGALNWDEFSRDLIVASHFTHIIGVYNLEGSVRQGFLPRLKTIDWAQTVTIPAEDVRGINRLGLIIRIVLWTILHLVYFAGAIIIAVIWLIWRRRSLPRNPPKTGSHKSQ
jgi:hypothetical protein